MTQVERFLDALAARGWMNDRQREEMAERGRAAAAAEGCAATAFSVARQCEDAGLLTAEQAGRELALLYGLAFEPDPAAVPIDATLLRSVPLAFAQRHRVLPVARTDGEVTTLVADPEGTDALGELGLLLGCAIRSVLAPALALERAIQRAYYEGSDSAANAIESLPEVAPGPTARPFYAAETEDLLNLAAKAPIVRLVNLILLDAVKAGASDVHFEPSEEALRVRYRIDGVLCDRPAPPAQHQAAILSRIKVMSGLNIAERRLPQDGRARIRVGEREMDIRVSAVPVRHGERIVLRLLDRDRDLRTMERLGMTPLMLGEVAGILGRSHGLFLVTGPTGSGKTTTLYGALSRIDCRRKNVMTIEDPIEYQVPDVGQIEVRPRIGLTFAAGLRHILRQDPDVVMVGEMRDLETAEIAIRASLTGHLVLSTLHTNSALEAIVRLVDMGIPRYLVAASSLAFLAQRLVRVLCPACRAPLSPAESASVLEALGAAGSGNCAPGRGPLYRAVGCAACRDGFRGRTGVFELLPWDETVRAQVHDGATASEIERHLRGRSVPSLRDDARAKVLAGVTTADEVLRVL